MQTFIVLGKYTAEGKKHMHELGSRLDSWKEIVETAGGRWLGYYLTLGRYDMLIIVQAPDAETMASMLVANGMLGVNETETLAAFTQEEAVRLIANLPGG